ncbi:MAG: F0F1 ATP synthase subunit B [Verrucomicrobiae bacterium]|nr:F0F1 ATP synthase subunit B [Verrucomicrobiae bacterium]
MNKRLFAGWSLLVCPLAVRAAGGEAGTDPLQLDWGLQIWVVLTFVVMMGLLAKLAFKPIAEALERRGATIKAQLDEAERSRAEAKKLMQEYQEQLAKARAEAGKILEEARALGEKIRKEMLDKAAAESAALVQRAQEEIVRQKEKGVQELKETVADLSVQIATRILERELNADVHRQLVDNLIRNLAHLRKN